MKDGNIRKFLNAVSIVKSGGKKNQRLELMKASQNHLPSMPDKVKLLLILQPQIKKHEMYNKLVECLFEESFPLMEIDSFLELAKSQEIWDRNFKNYVQIMKHFLII